MAHIRRLFGLAPDLRQEVHPNFVKALIPPSSFTQHGPGVRAQLRRALWAMTPLQRKVAKRRGWDKGLLYLTPLRYNKRGKMIGGGTLELLP